MVSLDAMVKLPPFNLGVRSLKYENSLSTYGGKAAYTRLIPDPVVAGELCTWMFIMHWYIINYIIH